MMFDKKMFEGAMTVHRLIQMVIGTLAGLSFVGIGGFLLIIYPLYPDNIVGEGTIIFPIIGVLLVVAGLAFVLKSLGVRIKRKRNHKRRIKIKYLGNFFPHFLIFFGIAVACFGIPCFVHGEVTAAYVVGVVLFLIGVGCLVTPGVIMKIKDDFKRRKRFMKNGRYAIKAVVTEVVCAESDYSNGTTAQHIIAKSEQTGLEYTSDKTWNDLHEYINSEVWVYLDPNDQSEYGKYFVDLRGMVQKYANV